jgi:hypothetical protein
MKAVSALFFLPLSVVLAGPAVGQEMFIYPEQGQTQDQQKSDEYQCYNWAKGETGFDPMAAPVASTPPPDKGAPKGGVVRGALRGAAVGAIIDGSDGAKKGAGAGAVMGGVRRADQNRRQQKSEQQWADEQARQYSENRSRYNKAYSACMEGRGYSVRY